MFEDVLNLILFEPYPLFFYLYLMYSEYFTEKQFSKPRVLAGIMSGTSLDGVDCAVVEFKSDGSGKRSFKLLGFVTKPYSPQTKELILKTASSQTGAKEISRLNFKLAEIFSDAVVDACAEANIAVADLDGVGSHGQTIWHEPKPATGNVGSTLQIGSHSALACALGVPTVGDFRAADVAFGGEGAPLVPIFDYDFLSRPDKDVIALNIGGIANFTYMPAGADKSDTLAFDAGPGNVLIDAFAKKLFSADFDEGGKIARSGTVNNELFIRLQSIRFIKQKPPKSTGRELFNAELVEKLTRDLKIEPRDLIRTLTEFTAWSVAENVALFADEKADLYVSGGGAANGFLMELLQNKLPRANVKTSDVLGVRYDAKEAICFAYLAYKTLGGEASSLPSATGAKKAAILGTVAL